MKIISKLSFLFLAILVFSGCSSTYEASSQAIGNSSVAVNALPAAAAYGSVYLSNNSVQAVSISLDMNPSLYSKTVTKKELVEIAQANGWKFYEPWKYMGSKNEYHYLALYPFAGFRKVYRIHKDEFEIENTFQLTSLTSKWRDITIVEYNFVEHEIFIQAGNDFLRLENRLEDNQFYLEYEPLSLDQGAGGGLGYPIIPDKPMRMRLDYE